MKKLIILIILMSLCFVLWSADSTRTRTALETLFADQQTGAISAQDLRDFLASVFIQTDDDTLDILGEYLDSTGINYLNSLFDTDVTSTEFDYLDGVTSNIQDQLQNYTCIYRAIWYSNNDTLVITATFENTFTNLTTSGYSMANIQIDAEESLVYNRVYVSCLMGNVTDTLGVVPTYATATAKIYIKFKDKNGNYVVMPSGSYLSIEVLYYE